MTSLSFIDHVPEVMLKQKLFADVLLGLMAAGIEVQIKTSGNTPIFQGNLRSSARHRKIGEAEYVVEDTANYAAAQEVGYRHTKAGDLVEFKNHPKGGGAHYFQKAIDTTTGRKGEYIATAKGSVGL